MNVFKSKLKFKIGSQGLILILISVMLIEGYYWAIIPKFFLPQLPRYILWALLLCATIIAKKGKLRISIYHIPWILYLLMILIRNQEFSHGEYLNSLRIILCLMIVFVCSSRCDWILKIGKLIGGIGILNVFATVMFYFSNSLYEKFISMTYRTYQNGTANGLYGYRAGLADHYSQNGTYISMVLLSLLAIYFASRRHKGKKGVLLLGLCFLSSVALLLTGKRAHLLFVIATTIIIYYISNPDRRVGNTFKLMITIVILSFIGSLLIEYIPQLAYTFERLQSVGTDSASMNRIIMWEYAIEMIKESPIFGVGWWGFRYQSNIIQVLRDAVTGCHNVYLEIMANCGLVGFAILIAALLSSLITNMNNLKYCSTYNGLSKYKSVLLTTMAIQIFCLMYGFTGNVIFDRTFHFYMVAVGANLAFTVNRSRCMKKQVFTEGGDFGE